MDPAFRAEGALLIDKPDGPTSHDVVAKVRHILQVKAGHTGTLDPAASGLLVILLGRATRLASLFSGADKEYLARIVLGATSETYDREGKISPGHSIPKLSRDEIDGILDRFRGEIDQLPPMYSAVRVDGQRLYQAARRNLIRERPLRRVRIHRLELLGQEGNSWTIRVLCSAGTYIRSLAHDIGAWIGCGAYLGALRRTRCGTFGLQEAQTLETLEKDPLAGIVSTAQLLPELPAVHLEAEQALRIQHGNSIPGESIRLPDIEEDRPLRLFFEGEILAIGRLREGVVKPEIVLRPLP